MICLKTALNNAVHNLNPLISKGGNPRLEAELLLCAVLNRPRSYLATWPERPLSVSQKAAYNKLVQRRKNGEPIAYILGYKDFWTIKLHTTKDVLIPRPETELLVEIALQLHPTNKALEILDLGTGSGAIALALATERPTWRIHATDIAKAALAITSYNAQMLNQPIQIHLGNWYTALPSQLRFDLIISNPPYIAENDPHLTQGDLAWEPQQALIAGIDGLEALRTLCNQCTQYLKPGGTILLEHGYNQAVAVRTLLQRAGLTNIQTWRDLIRYERVTGALFDTISN
ncbi:hypothetical protein TI03_00840 [Achromatium sp. WMS1]|nr:hypothetical protein TI03_00840 [Achromatium sp. WMS1]